LVPPLRRCLLRRHPFLFRSSDFLERVSATPAPCALVLHTVSPACLASFSLPRSAEFPFAIPAPQEYEGRWVSSFFSFKPALHLPLLLEHLLFGQGELSAFGANFRPSLRLTPGTPGPNPPCCLDSFPLFPCSPKSTDAAYRPAGPTRWCTSNLLSRSCSQSPFLDHPSFSLELCRCFCAGPL